MAHLEDLLCEWYDWRGFHVRRNVKVGRLGHGGWEGELDVVAYHPESKELVHIEPSLDAHPWPKREQRFTKKFSCGKRFIYTDVFPWVDPTTPLRQIAVLVSRGAARETLGGGEIITIDELISKIKADIAAEGKMASRAIPEKYPLLRTLQLALSGYYRRG